MDDVTAALKGEKFCNAFIFWKRKSQTCAVSHFFKEKSTLDLDFFGNLKKSQKNYLEFFKGLVENTIWRFQKSHSRDFDSSGKNFDFDLARKSG